MFLSFKNYFQCSQKSQLHRRLLQNVCPCRLTLIELWNYCESEMSRTFFFLHLSIQFSSVVFLILSLRRNEGTLKKMEVNMYRESTFKNQQKCQVDFLIFILMAITATFFLLFFLLMKVFSLSVLYLMCHAVERQS